VKHAVVVAALETVVTKEREREVALSQLPKVNEERQPSTFEATLRLGRVHHPVANDRKRLSEILSPFRLMGPPVFNDMGHGEQERVTEWEHAPNAVVMEAVSEGAGACPVSW
jgi:hypothetical protein